MYIERRRTIHCDDTKGEGLADLVHFSNGPCIRGECKQVAKVRMGGSYRRYTLQQTEKLFDLMIKEGSVAKEAALIADITIQIAQHYIKTYNRDEEKCLSGAQRKPHIKLTETHI